MNRFFNAGRGLRGILFVIVLAGCSTVANAGFFDWLKSLFTRDSVSIEQCTQTSHRNVARKVQNKEMEMFVSDAVDLNPGQQAPAAEVQETASTLPFFWSTPAHKVATVVAVLTLIGAIVYAMKK